MEVLLPNSCDLQKFIMAWVAAAGDAAGQSTKITIELEALESQGELSFDPGKHERHSASP